MISSVLPLIGPSVASPDPHALVEHLQRGGHAFGRLDVGDHGVGDARVALLQQTDVGVRNEDTVGGNQPAVEQTERVEVLDRRHGVVAPDRRHFLGHFRKVDHDRGVELGGETGDVAQVRGVDGVGARAGRRPR
jgi:hypothetical protein